MILTARLPELFLQWIVSEPAGTDISIDDTVYFGASGKSVKLQITHLLKPRA